jgi:hypothetical protein
MPRSAPRWWADAIADDDRARLLTAESSLIVREPGIQITVADYEDRSTAHPVQRFYDDLLLFL